jgi:hypothetical protein
MPDSRRPKHPHAVSSFTRKERANKNMHPEPHYALPDDFEGQKRKYKGSVKRVAKRTQELFEEKMKKYREDRAAAKGGRTRRGRKSRSTRRR